MKKSFYLLVLFSFFLGFVSCKQESATEYPITGDWKPVENVVTTVSNGQSHSTIEPYTACEQKSIFAIKEDNTVHYSAYEVNPVNGNCEEFETEDYTYTYDKNAKSFTLKSSSETTVYQVVKLTDKELQIKETNYDVPTAPVSNTTLFRKN